MLSGNRTDLKRQFGRGCQRVSPYSHRRGARVRLLAVERDRVSLNTFGAQYDSERQTQAFQHRTLLNVQFQIGCRVRSFAAGFRESIDLDSAEAQRILEPNAVFIGSTTV